MKHDFYTLRELVGNALDQAFAKEPTKKDSGHDSPPKGYPKDKNQYADPANYKYPIDTAEHVKAAWSYINQAKNRTEYTAQELAYIENRIKSAAKKFGVDISDKS